jgi:outer membrane protein OmpA-like peptidoglycan-associated protein
VNLNKRVLKKYNPASDTWTTAGTCTWSKETKSPNFTDIIGNNTSFSVNEKAYIITGEKKKGKYINQLWELDLHTFMWNQKNDLPFPGSDSINVCKMEGKSYVLKGCNNFLKYDLGSDTWTEKKEISAPNKNFSPLFTVGDECYGFSNHEFWMFAPVQKEAIIKTNPIMTVSVDTIKRTSVPAPASTTAVAPATSPTTTTVIKTTISFNNVLFAFAKSKLRKEYLPELDKAIDLLKKEDSKIKFEIAGFTDSKGKAAYNKALSKRRAEAVANYLASKGINRSRMKVFGYGKEKPIAPNKNADGSDSPEGRAKNRRTEIVIIR